MKNILSKRRVNFLPKKQYDKLDDKVKEELLKYQRLYTRIVNKDKKIERLLKKVDEERELLREMKKDLTSKNEGILHLRSMYSFSCSVIRLKPRPSGKVYYNLSISRGGITKPKNVSLGSEEIIKEHLTKFFEGKRTKLRELKKDWKQFVWDECNKWDTYDRIFDIINKNPLGFNEQPISRDDLFPLKK